MRSETKLRLQQLAAEIFASQSSEAMAIKEILSTLLVEAKDGLISSTGEATLLLQGEAQATKRLLLMCTTAPTPIGIKGNA